MQTDVVAEVAVNKIPQAFFTGATIAGALAALLLAHWLLRIIFTNRKEGVEKKIYLYPLPIRIWHWTNAIMFMALLFTGVTGWLKLWNMKGALINAHIVLGSVYIFLWVFFIAYNMMGNGKNYIIRAGLVVGCIRQAGYYLIGVMIGDKEPFAPSADKKFNPLQQITYASVIYALIPLFILSGILQMIKPIHGLMMRTHIFIGAFAAALFVIVHLYMALSNNSLKSMIDGYERYKESNNNAPE